MKLVHWIFGISLLIAGCDKEASNNSQSCDGVESSNIKVSIYNTSAFEVVDFNYDNIQTFSSILPGETTSAMELESSFDVPSYREMTINEKFIQLQLIDLHGANALDNGCYTYMLYAYEYDDGEILTGGRIYSNEVLRDFDPKNQDCNELDKEDCDSDNNKINIRLKNSTAFDFCNVEIEMTDQGHVVYGNLASGETTCFISFNIAKEYPLLCVFQLGDEPFIIENPTYHERLDNLPAGFYTYNISIISPTKKLGDIQLSSN